MMAKQMNTKKEEKNKRDVALKKAGENSRELAMNRSTLVRMKANTAGAFEFGDTKKLKAALEKEIELEEEAFSLTVKDSSWRGIKDVCIIGHITGSVVTFYLNSFYCWEK